jgi:hypothetical protein
MTFEILVGQIISVINVLVALLGSVALVIFLWGAVRFLYLSGDSHDKQGQKELLGWGLVALFVLVSIFGILQLLQGIFLPS